MKIRIRQRALAWHSEVTAGSGIVAGNGSTGRTKENRSQHRLENKKPFCTRYSNSLSGPETHIP